MSEEPPSAAETIEEVLDYVKAYFPEHYALFKGRLNHVRRRLGGVLVAAVVVCEVLGVVLGI